MTTKEASRIFHIDEREIRKRYGDGMIIAAYKDGNFIVVPDETEIIPSKQEVELDWQWRRRMNMYARL